jgi:hypothetical protein
MTATVRSRVAGLLGLSRALRGERILRLPGGLPAASWEEIVELAVSLDVAPALWTAVGDTGQLLPSAPAERLHDYYRANTLRNLRLRTELTEAIQALNRAGVTPLLFKGSLGLVDGSHAHPGERWMVDLDLAVPPGQRGAAVRALTEMGYRPEPGMPYLHLHELPLVRDRTAAPIEVHVELGTTVLASVLPASEAWEDSLQIEVDGALARGLSPTHQVLHNILHAAVQDRNHAVGGLPLRQLLILSGLQRAHGSAVDWPAIARRTDEHGLSRQRTAHIWLAHHLTGMPLPEGARPARLHEARVLLGFGLPGITEAQRNVRFVLGREYLNWKYPHGSRSVPLAMARARHIARVLRRDRLRALHRAAERKM